MQMSFSASAKNSLLKKLDATIEKKAIFVQKKEQRIDSLKQLLNENNNVEHKCRVLADIVGEYKLYNTDSLFKYVNIRQQVAQAEGTDLCKKMAKMNEIEAMYIAGMYKEAFDEIENLQNTNIEPELKPYFFHLQNTLFYLMLETTPVASKKEAYQQMRNRYRDSILSVNDSMSFVYVVVSSSKGQNPESSIEALKKYQKTHKCTKQDLAILSFCQAEIFENLSQRDSAEYYYILSAINDIEMGTREYVSLRKLALMLYEDGDVRRAYKYLSCAMEDAVLCKAQMRTMEVTTIFPIIQEAYQKEVSKYRTQMIIFVASICVLLILVIFAFVMVLRQMKKVSDLRNKTAEMNISLQKINEELKSTNNELIFSNKVKEEYIGRYMDLCSSYIEKLDNFRRDINKSKKEGQSVDLFSILSPKKIEKELNEFYQNFDASFLTIFPDFVEKFNLLLQEDEQITLKTGERLNTDLRVYALVRLGINDSAKIAKFLRFSASTIYNCRVRMRNKSCVNRAEFEQKVMEIL